MKKLLSLLLVAAMGLSLVGCGGSDNGSKSESKSDLEYVKIWHQHLQRALG